MTGTITISVNLRWDGDNLHGPGGVSFGQVWRVSAEDWHADYAMPVDGVWAYPEIVKGFATKAEAKAAVEDAVIKALGAVWL